jgi:chemotaxis signal transduction protein
MTELTHVMPIQLGDDWVAIPAQAVAEILGAVPWVPLPGAIPAVPGVIPWRGQAIAVVDLALLCGIAPPMVDGEVRPRLVVARVDATMLAMPVRAVREVCAVPSESVRRSTTTMIRLARAELEIDERVVPVVDLDAAVALLTGREAEVA